MTTTTRPRRRIFVRTATSGGARGLGRVRGRGAAGALFLVCLLGVGCQLCPHPPAPAHWAVHVEDDEFEGIYRVTDRMYRGIKPSDDDHYQALRRLGVRTIVSLRLFDHGDERRARAHGFDFVRIPIKVWDIQDKDLEQFLRVADDPRYQPLYVHCALSRDRLGLCTAVYRVVAQGWTKQEAIREMYRPEWKFWFWHNLVTYIERMDAQRLRQ